MNNKKINLKELKKLIMKEVKKYSRRAYEQKLWEAHVEPQQFSIYEKRIYNDYLITELFSLDEKEIDQEKTNLAKQAIGSNDWVKVSGHEYLDSLSMSDKPEMLTKYSTSELAAMDLYKLKGYNIGFALKQFTNPYTEQKEFGISEIVAVHNNEPGVGGIGKILMASAIENGGCYLDHFDGFLSNLYGNMGFKEYMRYEFNPDYAPANFEKKYGRQDVIYRHHQRCQPPFKPNEDEDS